MAIWQQRKRVLGMFSPRMRRNSYLGTSGPKSEPCDLCIGGPPKPHVTIFAPFYGATMTIKGSLYWSIPMLKRFLAAKKLSPVKIGPRNGGFSEI